MNKFKKIYKRLETLEKMVIVLEGQSKEQTKNKGLDVEISVTCSNNKELEKANEEVLRFIRRIKHIKNRKVNYELELEDLENGRIKVIKSGKELEEKIEELILSGDLTYKDVQSVLDRLLVTYMQKGDNLLKATNIQKVIETPWSIR